MKPYAIDARYYDWQTEMAGIFCSNYEKTYGRKYGSLRLDTGYDFDTNTKVVTVRKSKFYVMDGCNLPAEALPADKKDEKKK